LLFERPTGRAGSHHIREIDELILKLQRNGKISSIL